MKDLKNIFNDEKYKESVNNIYNALDHQVKTPNANLNVFTKELLDLWFDKRAFRNVFCGKPTKKKVRGFHFAARYLEAQQKQFAGKGDSREMKNCKMRVDEIRGPVYVTAIMYKYKNKVKSYCARSFDISLNAEKLFINATKAYKQLYNKNKGDLSPIKQCLYDLHRDGFDYKAVFIAENEGIITFYPDLNPSCSFGKQTCSCE